MQARLIYKGQCLCTDPEPKMPRQRSSDCQARRAHGHNVQIPTCNQLGQTTEASTVHTHHSRRRARERQLKHRLRTLSIHAGKQDRNRPQDTSSPPGKRQLKHRLRTLSIDTGERDRNLPQDPSTPSRRKWARRPIASGNRRKTCIHCRAKHCDEKTHRPKTRGL